MSEIIIYRQALVPAQRIIVNNYLSAKYNISLSANDKYAGDNAVNGDYDFDVAGIGKESTGSNTSFSTSISKGLGLSVSAGLDNTDYLLAGHATTTNSVNTSDVSGMSGLNNGRWQRVWYVDVTNTLTALSASVTFNLSDGGLPGTPSTASNYKLIYRAAQTGSWTELATALSVSGSNILFGAITFSNDGYYTLGSITYSLSTLPIELLDFTATAIGNEVELDWATASEKNNAYFAIEKSKDGLIFEKVLIAKGKGNSATHTSYRGTDPAPYKGLSYYRLKQTDADNSSTYFPLVFLDFGSSGSEVTVYPNPGDGIVNIDIHSTRNEDITVWLADENGKTSFFKKYAAGNYDQLIHLNAENRLAEGNYIIIIHIGERSFVQKLVIR